MPGPVVDDAQPHQPARLAGAQRNPAVTSEALERLAGVADDVENDLLELVRVTQDRRQAGGVFTGQGDVVHPHVVRHDLKDGVCDLMQVEQLALGFVLAGETEEAVDDLVATHRIARDVAEVFLLLGIGAGGLQQFGEADH